MAVITEVGRPDTVKQDERGFTARWRGVCELAPEHGCERKANVVLSIHHLERRGYVANLMNEAESTDGILSMKFDFSTNAAVKLVSEPAARMSRKRLTEVLERAIAETQRRYRDGDERVRALWQGVGC